MLPRYLLYSLSLCWTILVLSIPQHDAQQPFLLDQQHDSVHPHATSVILEFTKDRDSMDRIVGIPLRTRITPGMDLPRHLNTLKIIAATTEQGQSTSLENLNTIICRVTPEISVEERAATEAGMESKVWPWFFVKDGRVRFGDVSSRWFLGGRAIESYECR